MGRLYEVRYLSEGKHLEVIEGLIQRLDAKATLDDMLQWIRMLTDMPLVVVVES
jgi:hypothetical protein